MSIAFLFININQLDALNLIMTLFQASTCFEHMCSSSGGQNCIIQHLVSSHLYVAVPCTDLCAGIITLIGGRSVHTYRCDDTRDCIVQFCPPDDEHICSKHVEAWSKLIIIFSATSWLILRNKYIEMHGHQNIKKTLHVSDSSSVHHQEFFTVHTAKVYVIQVLLTACEQDQDGTSWSWTSCMTHIIAVCTVKNSWWWTEELSETSRVLFQK